MKVIKLLSVFLLYVSVCQGQNLLLPGEQVFDERWMKDSKFEMSYWTIKDNQKEEIGSFEVALSFQKSQFSVFTKLQFINSDEKWIDTCISDKITFKPIYRSSYNKDKDFAIKYQNGIKGFYYDKKSKKRKIVNEMIKEDFFDFYSYPYLLSLLPLTTGYKKDLVVYDYNPESSNNIKKARIEEVKSNIYVSSNTGEHKVWQISVFEETTNDQYQYYIDKETRKIWKIEILAKGQQLLLLNKELDFNPYTVKFDKEKTLKLVKDGNSVISGQAFARDNHNDGMLKGMAVLNVNKKQYAAQGIKIILIPYTEFFKEWLAVNEKSRKKGLKVPLPKEAADCIKTTTIYDNEGHFEFTSLMPGDYLLYTEFGYVHTGIKTEVVGYTDTYINGMFQGSRENTKSFGYSSNAAASIKKIVTITQEGENVSVKLKKTL
jgi:hypothetical protein